MLKLICVEFKKLRRRREVLFMLLAAFIMPAVSLFYFYTHRDMLTDIGLYKQAILSFNIFLILPALLGILSATIVYREQADDVFKQGNIRSTVSFRDSVRGRSLSGTSL